MNDDLDATRIVRAVLEAAFRGDRETMARDTGFDVSSISRFLRGVRPPSAKFLDRLARLPTVDPRFVRDGIGQPLRPTSAERSYQYALPIAKSLLPGPPDRFPTLMTPESLEVPSSVCSRSAYAVRANCALAADRHEEEGFLPNDAIVIQTDLQALRSILQREPYSLKVYARRSGSTWETMLARKPPDSPRRPVRHQRQIDIPMAPMDKPRRKTGIRSAYSLVAVANFLFRIL